MNPSHPPIPSDPRCLVAPKSSPWRTAVSVCLGLFALLASHPARAETTDGATLYRSLRDGGLGGGAVTVSHLVLHRDRVEIIFDGSFYFAAPVEGRILGAVFIGRGSLRATIPPESREAANVKRLLDADVVASDFRTAVLRFTDDTLDVIGAGRIPDPAPPSEAAKRWQSLAPDLLDSSGINLPARVLVSLMNNEQPGVFFAQLDGGKRGRFNFLFDPQCRLPTTHLGINAGEKGIIFQLTDAGDNEVWLAFHSLADYADRQSQFSDHFDLVDTGHYEMKIDVRDFSAPLRVEATLSLVARGDGARAIPFELNQHVDQSFLLIRQHKWLKATSARLADGVAATVIQEKGEVGLTVLLPAALSEGQRFALTFEEEGDYSYNPHSNTLYEYFPVSNEHWYPRHGVLNRSTYDLTFRHGSDYRVGAPGVLVDRAPDPAHPGETLTHWRMAIPVPLVSFAVAEYTPVVGVATRGKDTFPVEFYALPNRVKGDFVLAEMTNAVHFFSKLFGDYPFPTLRAVYHPRSFGQGFPGLLFLPAADLSNKRTFKFIAHETSHQWWGDVVTWRSYRDQWLSEGFADYSGLLYVGLRDSLEARLKLLSILRADLRVAPRSQTGMGEGQLATVGPLIYGHRLRTRESWDGYQALVYGKGALVLRMLHFLLTDQRTGEGQAFFDMMTDFVNRHRNRAASTEDFLAVANEHIVKTAMAQRLGIKNLDWFFRQWVYQSWFPSYRLDYAIERAADGSYLLRGTLQQGGVPASENWVMPLPVAMEFEGGKVARAIVVARGAAAPVELRLPAKPKRIELDPEMWILSSETSTHER